MVKQAKKYLANEFKIGSQDLDKYLKDYFENTRDKSLENAVNAFCQAYAEAACIGSNIFQIGLSYCLIFTDKLGTFDKILLLFRPLKDRFDHFEIAILS